MNFSAWPPEVNSAHMFAGPGSGPMLAAATAWDGLSAELGSAASSFGSVTSGLAGGSWQGPASTAMAAAAAPYAGWLNAAAADAQHVAAQARATAASFDAAFAATVPLPQVVANRSRMALLAISNLFGQNGPAIAAA